MKHTAIALALLGLFASAAHAQSSVTLYGRLNVTLESQSVGDASRVNKMADNSSRWGVKGSEDLGGGMRANFVFEQGFDTTTGLRPTVLRASPTSNWPPPGAPCAAATGRPAPTSPPPTT